MSHPENEPGKSNGPRPTDGLGEDKTKAPSPNLTNAHKEDSFALGDNYSKPGDSIGPYKLVQQVGMGGMGEVWMAEQSHPVKRRVALKLILAGVGTKEIIARFDAERQALAMMNHPNIARILDAGTTNAGQPYFVMELVSGTSLTTYCDNNRLSINERLKLFTDVCAGVQHAHQKGIIHRDLKPGNIIVGMRDGQPAPKIIDFGLAKAMEHMNQLTDQSLFTGIGQILGTLKYMSPEQASLDSHDIDTRTDIYALGVILYELLTGSVPLDDAAMKGQAVLQLLEVIRDKEPIKPSSKLIGSTVNMKSTITNERRTDTVQLNRVLSGDLDWIVMKALDKDRTRRYESASGFADDVQRYLNHEPVIARPPTLKYRISKFVQKNRAGVVGASLLAAALLAGIVGTTWGMVKANRSANKERIAKEAESIALANETEQRKLADEAKANALAAAEKERAAKEQAQRRLVQIEKGNEILGGIFEDLDIKAVKKGTEPLEAVLAKRLVAAGEQLEGESIGDPETVAGLQDRVARSLTSLGFDRDALNLNLRAFNTRKAKLGTDHPQTLASMNYLALSYQANGELEKAARLHEQTMEIRKTKLGAEHPDTLTSMNNLATAYHSAGKLRKALPMFEQALEILKTKRGADHPDTLQCMNNLAVAYKAAGELKKALPLLRQILETRKTCLGPDHPDTLQSMNFVALTYKDVGELDQALTLFEQTLEMRKTKLGSDHPSTLDSMNNLAVTYQAAGQLKKAVLLLERTLEIRKTKLGAEHADTLTSISNLAIAYQAAGKFKKAVPLLEQMYNVTKAKLGADHPRTLIAMNNLATTYRAVGDLEKALPMLEQALEMRKAKSGSDHPETMVSMNNLALAYQAAGDLDKALPLLKQTLEKLESKFGSVHPYTLSATNNLAVGYKSAGDLDKALPLLEQAMEKSKTKFGANHPDTLLAQANLGMIYRDVGRIDEGIAALEKVVSQIHKFPNLARVRHELYKAYVMGKRRDKHAAMAEEDLRKAREQYPDGSLKLASKLSGLGDDWLTIGDPVAAEPLLRESLEILQQKIPKEWRAFHAQALLGVSLAGQEKWVKAQPLLEAGYAGLKATAEEIPASFRKEILNQALDNLIALTTATKDADGLKKWTVERATCEPDKPTQPESTAPTDADKK